MRRIENRFKWKTLKHWLTVIQAGAVRVNVLDDNKVEEKLVESSINLLENNCFPIALICYRGQGQEKEIWATSLWAEIFKFLENKRCIRREEENLIFRDMTDDEQKAILDAWIESVWLEEE